MCFSKEDAQKTAFEVIVPPMLAAKGGDHWEVEDEKENDYKKIVIP